MEIQEYYKVLGFQISDFKTQVVDEVNRLNLVESTAYINQSKSDNRTIWVIRTESRKFLTQKST